MSRLNRIAIWFCPSLLLTETNFLVSLLAESEPKVTLRESRSVAFDVQNLSKKSHGPTLMREKIKFKELHTTKRGARRGRRRVGRGRRRTKTKTRIKVYRNGQREKCQLILRRITKIVATRCQIYRLKCTKFDFGWALPQIPLGELTALPQTL